MTGFGRGEAARQGRAFTVEIQSVNHRFLEVRCRLPKRLAGLEPRAQRAVQQRFARGHFEVSVQEKDLEGRARTLKVDLPLARQYVELLRALQREMDLPGQVTLEMLAGQRELISVEESEETVEDVWAELEPALTTALDSVAAMRCQEGAALVEALRRHLDEIEAVLGAVLGRTADLVTTHRTRLRERVADLLDGRLPDPLRLEQEVALLAGVSVSWYTWLEQGRPINPSVDVLDALVTVLGPGDDVGLRNAAVEAIGGAGNKAWMSGAAIRPVAQAVAADRSAGAATRRRIFMPRLLYRD